jgi:hypothetical protein
MKRHLEKSSQLCPNRNSTSICYYHCLCIFFYRYFVCLMERKIHQFRICPWICFVSRIFSTPSTNRRWSVDWHSICIVNSSFFNYWSLHPCFIFPVKSRPVQFKYNLKDQNPPHLLQNQQAKIEAITLLKWSKLVQKIQDFG